MLKTRQALAQIAEGPREIPTWQVDLEVPSRAAGFKLTLSGFAHGRDKEEAAAKLVKEIEYLLVNSGNWTPWNAAAKAEEDAGSNHTVRRGDGKNVRVFIPRK